MTQFTSHSVGCVGFHCKLDNFYDASLVLICSLSLMTKCIDITLDVIILPTFRRDLIGFLTILQNLLWRWCKSLIGLCATIWQSCIINVALGTWDILPANKVPFSDVHSLTCLSDAHFFPAGISLSHSTTSSTLVYIIAFYIALFLLLFSYYFYALANLFWTTDPSMIHGHITT